MILLNNNNSDAMDRILNGVEEILLLNKK